MCIFTTKYIFLVTSTPHHYKKKKAKKDVCKTLAAVFFLGEAFWAGACISQTKQNLKYFLMGAPCKLHFWGGYMLNTRNSVFLFFKVSLI